MPSVAFLTDPATRGWQFTNSATGRDGRSRSTLALPVPKASAGQAGPEPTIATPEPVAARCPMIQDNNQDIAVRLDRIEMQLAEVRDMLASQRTLKDWYTTEEFAALVGKAEFTVREWCRLDRIHAEKRHSGRGKHCAWVISNDELLRYQREGLLPPKH